MHHENVQERGAVATGRRRGWLTTVSQPSASDSATPSRAPVCSFKNQHQPYRLSSIMLQHQQAATWRALFVHSSEIRRPAEQFPVSCGTLLRNELLHPGQRRSWFYGADTDRLATSLGKFFHWQADSSKADEHFVAPLCWRQSCLSDFASCPTFDELHN